MTSLSDAASPLRVLLVDDEALARSRMRSLLADCTEPMAVVQGEAANAAQAMEQLQLHPCDVVLLDIHMPGVNGVALAQKIRELTQSPALIFVTALTAHAVQAFELEAVDYLTKPVRLERLQAALFKVRRNLLQSERALTHAAEETLIIHERNRMERVPLFQVVYFKAELKYITARTEDRSYILDGSLNELEQKYGTQFLRIHRNALVAIKAIRALERHQDPTECEGWAVRLHGVDERLLVSRRQLLTVRDLVGRKT